MKPKRSLIYFLITVIALVSFGAAFAFARDEQAPGAIQEEMTPEEFKAAGLDKLSSGELAQLNNWLNGYRQKVEQKIEKKSAEREKLSKLQLIVSRYDGVWTGAVPGEIIQLEDGSKWKLANKDEHYGGHADHPAIAVYKAGIFGWKMRVSRIAEFYVNPVK
jgi:hypothetical protein